MSSSADGGGGGDSSTPVSSIFHLVENIKERRLLLFPLLVLDLSRAHQVPASLRDMSRVHITMATSSTQRR